jgi:hypothetical protein
MDVSFMTRALPVVALAKSMNLRSQYDKGNAPGCLTKGGSLYGLPPSAVSGGLGLAAMLAAYQVSADCEGADDQQARGTNDENFKHWSRTAGEVVARYRHSIPACAASLLCGHENLLIVS